jgi:hypothetical protein
VTQVRLQGGKPILGDGKVGTADACCCGEQEGCPEGCECLGIACTSGGISCDGAASAAEWIASVEAWIADQGLKDTLEGNGYTRIAEQSAGVSQTTTCQDENGNDIPYDPDIHGPPCREPPNDPACDCCDVWVANYTLNFTCCGVIDYEAEPIWEPPGFQEEGVPRAAAGFACFSVSNPIFPCAPNPLP